MCGAEAGAHSRYVMRFGQCLTAIGIRILTLRSICANRMVFTLGCRIPALNCGSYFITKITIDL